MLTMRIQFTKKQETLEKRVKWQMVFFSISQEKLRDRNWSLKWLRIQRRRRSSQVQNQAPQQWGWWLGACYYPSCAPGWGRSPPLSTASGPSCEQTTREREIRLNRSMLVSLLGSPVAPSPWFLFHRTAELRVGLQVWFARTWSHSTQMMWQF